MTYKDLVKAIKKEQTEDGLAYLDSMCNYGSTKEYVYSNFEINGEPTFCQVAKACEAGLLECDCGNGWLTYYVIK